MDLESSIKKAVEQFPYIKQMVGSEILQIAKEDSHSPIIYYLTKSLIDKSKLSELIDAFKKDQHIGVLVVLDHVLRPYYVLKHLDKCLSNLHDEKRIDTYLKHLSDSNSFWQGYCEIEVASNLKKIFEEIELEPKLPNGKVADVKFQLNSEDVFVEVTAPKSSYKFTKAMDKSAERGRVVELPIPTERASEKIIDELQHFGDKLDEVESIIILNLNQCEIEDIDIEESLMGVSKLVVSVNKKTHETKTRVAREDWTAFRRDSKLVKLGAIICYKREFALNGNIIFNKKIFVLSFDEKKSDNLLGLFQDIELVV